MASHDSTSSATAGALAHTQQQHTAGATVDSETLRKTLCEIQNMFSGHIDPDVVQLVLSECDYNVNEALETLMMLTAESISSQGPDNSREAPAVLDEVLMEETPLVGGLEREVSPNNDANNLTCSAQEISSVGGISRENNRISFIDTFSNEVYSSNEALYNDGHEANNEKEKIQNENLDENCTSKHQNELTNGENNSNLSPESDSSLDKNSCEVVEKINSCVNESIDSNTVKLQNELVIGENNSNLSHESNSLHTKTCEDVEKTNSNGSDSIDSNVSPSLEVVPSIQRDLSYSSSTMLTTSIPQQPSQYVVSKSNSTSAKEFLITNDYWIQQKNKIIDKIKAFDPVLVVLRGVPGSGKSTLAQQILFSGRILSSDDFFMKRIKGQMVYDFNPMRLGEAHDWNQKRTKKLLSKGFTPIIIDNTNTEIWEMKPYLALGIRYGFSVYILEPTTPWKFKARELSKKNSHGVPFKSIERMLQRYEHRQPDVIIKEICEGLNTSKLTQLNHVQENSIDCHKVTPKPLKIKYVESADSNQDKLGNNPENTSSVVSSSDYKDLSLQDLLTLSRQDSDCSKSSPEERSENEMDLTSWVDVTEQDQDQEFSWSHSKSYSNESEKCPKSPTTPNSPLKSCLKKSKIIDDPEQFDHFENCSTETLRGINDDVNTASWDIVSMNQNVEKSTAEGESSGKQGKKSRKPSSSVNKSSLLDSELKVKLCNENWVLPKFPSPKVIVAPIDPDLPKVYATTSTMTCDEDFVLLYKIQNNVPCDLDIFRILNTNPRLISCHTVETLPNTGSVLKLDKSSLTDEPPPVSLESSLKTLETMFPQIPSTDLADILQKCQGSYQWAVNIILDSGSTEFTYDSSNVSSFVGLVSGDQSNPNNIPDVIGMTYKEKAPEKSEDVDVKEIEDSSNDFINFYQSTIPMKLDREFASELIQSFGPVLPNMSLNDFSEDDLTLNIPHAVAFQLYAIWNKQIGNKPSGSQASLSSNVASNGGVFASGKSENKNKKKTNRSKCNEDKIIVGLTQEMSSLPQGKKSNNTICFKEIMDHEKAIELSKKEADKMLKKDMAIDFKSSFLRDLYPTIDANALNDLFEANKFSLENTLNAIRIAICEDGDNESGQQQFTANIVADCEQRIIQNLTSSQDVSEPLPYEYSATELRSKAREHQLRKNEYSSQAHEAFSRKMPSVASYYSRQAQIENEIAKKFNASATKAIHHEKNSSRCRNELDLHGLYVSEAVSAVKKFIAMKRQTLQESSSHSFNLHIITGRGNHSDQGIPKVRKAVISYFRSARLPYIELNGGLIQVILTK
ncbi:NEDD4-binding protein 2-like 1 [Nymphon striatum]|nr:NEDD4-binding protein 2-like 1 [Nymphon striatum]